MWTSQAARGLCSLGLALEVLERHAEVLAVAVDEDGRAAGLEHRERRRHEGVGGAEDLLAATPQNSSAASAPPRPARGRDGRHAVVLGPGGLELPVELALGPAAGVEDAVPQLVQPGAVALVEADRELRSRSLGSQSWTYPEERRVRDSQRRARQRRKATSAEGRQGPARLSRGPREREALISSVAGAASPGRSTSS